MGQKVHPYGFRLGYTKPWKSRWFVERDYDKLLLEDVKLKAELKDKLKSAGVSSIEIERPGNKLRVIIKTARPGIIIGRKGAEIDKLKAMCRSAPAARSTSISRKCTSRNWMRNWFRNRSRCNWKSASGSAAPCARRWIRRCASDARASRSA
jgi:ribosomal protein S3